MQRLALRLPPLLVLLLFAVLAGVLATLPAPAAGFQFKGQALVSGALAGVGLSVALAGVWAFRRARTTVNPLHPEQARVVVTAGVYRWSRNPMYLGMALLLSAWLLALGAWLALPCLPGFCLVLTEFQIKPEERALARSLGEPYEAYRHSTRRWL